MRAKSKMAGGGVWSSSVAVADSLSGLSAAGSTQATATAITSDYAVFGTVGASQGAVLPADPTMNDEHFVLNAGANALSLYPPTGQKINAGAANAAVSVPVGKSAHCIYVGAGQWIVVVSA